MPPSLKQLSTIERKTYGKNNFGRSRDCWRGNANSNRPGRGSGVGNRRKNFDRRRLGAVIANAVDAHASYSVTRGHSRQDGYDRHDRGYGDGHRGRW